MAAGEFEQNGKKPTEPIISIHTSVKHVRECAAEWMSEREIGVNDGHRSAKHTKCGDLTQWCFANASYLSSWMIDDRLTNSSNQQRPSIMPSRIDVGREIIVCSKKRLRISDSGWGNASQRITTPIPHTKHSKPLTSSQELSRNQFSHRMLMHWSVAKLCKIQKNERVMHTSAVNTF